MTMPKRDRLFRTSETAYAVDRNGHIIVWNQAAEKTFGYAESEALGQRCWELLSGRDVFGNKSCCEGCPIRDTAFNDESINRFQIDFQTAANETKRFTVSTMVLFNNPGEYVFVHLCHPESGPQPHTKKHPLASKKPKTLTPRETEVLTLLHSGKTVAEIATRLTVSTSTVRNHTQHILFKLHVHSQLEAVAQGRKLGLI